MISDAVRGMVAATLPAIRSRGIAAAGTGGVSAPERPSIAEVLAAAEEVARSQPGAGAGARRRLEEIAASGADEVAALAAVLLELSTTLEERTELLSSLTGVKDRIESELSAAHDIQLGLLPKILPRCPNHDDFELFGMIAPARGVGGDLYDFFWIDDHRFFFMIGDVSEKGVPAALLMAVTKTLMANHVHGGVQLCEALARVNDKLAESNDMLMFVTVFCGILDVRTGELEYCDGGHNVPCLLPSDAPATMLEKRTCIALGLSPGFEFQSLKVTLRPGDAIFLYTDGITEAMNAARDLYGEARLLATLDRLSGAPLRDVVHGVMCDVQRFADGAPQSDDIAMLTVRLRGQPSGAHQD